MTLKLNRVSNETAADRNNKSYLIPLVPFDCNCPSILETCYFAPLENSRSRHGLMRIDFFGRSLSIRNNSSVEIRGKIVDAYFVFLRVEGAKSRGRSRLFVFRRKTTKRWHAANLFAISSPSLAKFLPTKRGVVSTLPCQPVPSNVDRTITTNRFVKNVSRT